MFKNLNKSSHVIPLTFCATSDLDKHHVKSIIMYMQCLSRSLLNRSKLQFWTKLVVTCRTRQGVTYYNVFS